jgi:hypothetical protein
MTGIRVTWPLRRRRAASAGSQIEAGLAPPPRSVAHILGPDMNRVNNKHARAVTGRAANACSVQPLSTAAPEPTPAQRRNRAREPGVGAMTESDLEPGGDAAR